MVARTTRGASVLGLLGLTIIACGDHQAKHPGSGQLYPLVTAAFTEEALAERSEIPTRRWLTALEAAATSPDDPASTLVTMAALDALVLRNTGALAQAAPSAAIADFADPKTVDKPGATIDAQLARIQEKAEGPFTRGLIAGARLELAEKGGDAKAAGDHRAAKGCVREALVVGPTAWATVSDLGAATPFDGATAPIPASVPSPGPFLAPLTPAKIEAIDCRIALNATSTQHGTRDVIVDVEVPRKEPIGVSLRAGTAATLRAGGKLAIQRPYALGNGTVARFARVDVDRPGTLRLVARVGVEQDLSTVEIDAWDRDGRPLRARAPSAGQAATVTAVRVEPIVDPAPKTDAEKLTVALGYLAARDYRSAENLLHADSLRESAPPDLLLVYARALGGVKDLPPVKVNERARAALERVQAKWPKSWEAAIEHAQLAGSRRGWAEANLESLADLDKSRAASTRSAWANAILDIYEATIAGRERLYDRAQAALARARTVFGASAPLVAETERLVFERAGRENAAFECADNTGRNRSSLLCYHGLTLVGDRDKGERELERLRALAGSPRLYLSLSSRSAIETGDLARAAKIFEVMNPTDRTLGTLYALKGKAAGGELAAFAPTSRDAPSSIAPILRATGDDPLAAFEGVAERVTNDPTVGAFVANAATAVLAHHERYDIEPNGVVHFTMLDVRRVMGTTDVEANAQAAAPIVFARDTVRVLRRRILKKDGRIVLPDPTPNAAQSHADLSQLEAGDAVEAIYEGWGLPSEGGNVGIDTPDLLPERTAVKDARIELRIPASLKGSMWSHPMLGQADEKADRGKRVLTWTMKDRPVRRLEAGVPKMDRSVMVSFHTTTWQDVARGIRESIASLDADGPEVRAWAREASEGKPPSPALVESVVAAAGKAVKESSGVALTDLDMGRSGVGQSMTARTILANHEGSRTWLTVRALRELGVKVDVVVAENEPFSDSATFPPHYGRFMHPLGVAHVPDPDKPGATRDIWFDADVPGPPLPAGRISPELRGRMAMWPNGSIAPLPAIGGGAERDEIDIRLTLDDEGKAKGSLTVLLRGRSAQDLAEALVRIVGLERQRALRGIALAWVPFATVEKVELSSTEGSWQVAIRAELTAPAYAQVEGTKPGSRSWVLPGIDPIHYVFPRPYVSTLGSTYAAHGARENALAINHATQYHVRRRVELPPKAQIARMPGPFEGKGPLLDAQRKIAVNGQTIEEDFTLDVSTGTIPQGRYDAFVAEAHRTDDAFRASTRVKPPTP